MRATTIGILASALVLGAGAQVIADVQWAGNGHFYGVVSVPGGISWGEANVAATSAGKYLATITSQQENDFVFSLVDQPQYWHSPYGSSNYGPWLGGFQSPPTTLPATNWNWVTGEPWGYTNWHPGEPNDFQGLAQDRLMYIDEGTSVLRASTWNDEVSGGYGGHPPIAYVVESVPEPRTLFLLAIGATSVIAYAWRRRKS
jgi:hypothetical protein